MMKSKYWLYGILALAIIGVIVISGCVQQQNNQTETELIPISQNNFHFFEQRWFNSHLHDYEKNPYWCYHYSDQDPLIDGFVLKYKLIDIPKEPKDYHKYIRCKVYDGSTLLTAKDYNGVLMTQWGNDPEDVRGFDVGLKLNEDHNLNICCRIYDGFNSDEPISNEVCFSRQVNKIKCDRNLEREDLFKIAPPKYFTE